MNCALSSLHGESVESALTETVYKNVKIGFTFEWFMISIIKRLLTIFINKKLDTNWC